MFFEKSSSVLLEQNFSEKIKKRERYHFLFRLFSAFLIIMGVMFPIIAIIVFILNAIYFVFSSSEKIFFQLFFLLPFAAIFKLSTSSSSMFTYLELVAVIIFVSRLKKINLTFLILWFIFVIYLIIGCNAQYTVLIKQAIIPLLFYCFFSICRPDIYKFVINYTFSLVLSSFIALFGDRIPNMRDYISYIEAYELNNDVERFSALYYDPNYYSLNLIVIISVLAVLFVYKRITIPKFILSVAIISAFGAQTVSKSFLVMLGVVLVLFVYNLFANGKVVWGIVGLLAIIWIIILLLSGKISIFNNVVERFNQGFQKGDLTTNRVNIWSNYFEYFQANPWKTLFGSGAGAQYLNDVAAHNTYIDFIYYYGIFGSIIYISVLVCSIKDVEQKQAKMNLMPIISLFGTFLSLSCLMYFDFIFCIIMAVYISNYNFVSSENKEIIYNMDQLKNIHI